MSDCQNEVLTQTWEPSGKLFFTAKEFGSLAGVSKETVYRWAKLKNEKGEPLLIMKEFSPKEKRIPRSELERYLRGEMMEPR